MTTQETVLFVLAICSPVATMAVGWGMARQQAKGFSESIRKHGEDIAKIWGELDAGLKERSALTEKVAAHEKAIVRADTNGPPR